MGDKVFEQVTEYIDAISEKLGVATEHVIEVLIRQQYISGVIAVILGMTLLIIAGIIVRYTIKVYIEGETERRVKAGHFSITEPEWGKSMRPIQTDVRRGRR